MIYTGYFAKLNHYKEKGLIPICIAGYPIPSFNGICYRDLAPKKVWWKEWHDKQLGNDWYEMMYRKTVLDKLNPKEFVDYCNSLGNVVLLCYEKSNSFCHRQIVAKWLRENNFDCEEYKE